MTISGKEISVRKISDNGIILERLWLNANGIREINVLSGYSLSSELMRHNY